MKIKCYDYKRANTKKCKKKAEEKKTRTSNFAATKKKVSR